MTSHIDSTLHFNKHNTTEAGIPMLVDDYETPSDWWTQREGVRMDTQAAVALGERVTTALMAPIDHAAPAWTIEEFKGSLREPDMFDEGHAYWLTPEAVVYIDVTRIDEVQDILCDAERLRWHKDGCGWDRIHPSQYGVQVEWFDGSAHPAHTSWQYVTDACITQYDPVTLIETLP